MKRTKKHLLHCLPLLLCAILTLSSCGSYKAAYSVHHTEMEYAADTMSTKSKVSDLSIQTSSELTYNETSSEDSIISRDVSTSCVTEDITEVVDSTGITTRTTHRTIVTNVTSDTSRYTNTQHIDRSESIALYVSYLDSLRDAYKSQLNEHITALDSVSSVNDKAGVVKPKSILNFWDNFMYVLFSVGLVFIGISIYRYFTYK